MNTQQLQNAVDRYQTGGVEPVEINIQDNNGMQPMSPYDEYMQRLLNTPISGGGGEILTDEAISSGFGTSRYDSDYMSGMDLDGSRAKAQSGLAKIGAGILKGGVRVATTAANTVLGTVAGLTTGILDPFLDTDKDGKSGVMEAVDAATNNVVSKWLVGLNNTMEEIVPNYRRAEERTDEYQSQWYKPSHLFSANAIGDFFSNFGFTVGALLGGSFTSRIFGKAMSKKLAGDIMKGVVVGAEGNAKAVAELKQVSEALKAGSIVGVDANKLSANIQNIASQINYAEAKLQLYSAVVGAIGEGSMEGLMARDEFLEKFNKNLSERTNAAYNDAETQILNENDSRYVQIVRMPDESGNIASFPILTDLGVEELNRRRREIVEGYRAQQEESLRQGDRLASVTQMMNIPVLTTTNIMSFGRILSGGWKTSRRNAGKIAGKLSIANGKLTGEYTNAGGVARKTILKSLRTAATEGAEEMIQGAISSGMQSVADANISAFNDAGFDSDAINTYSRNLFSSFNQGAVDYLGDTKNWQEGFIGAITGLLGIPGKRWGGGVIGEYQQAKEDVNASKDAANELNTLVNSDEFQKRWRGFIRHLAYDDELKESLAADDQYAWHTADDNQLISDVITFANAGRLNDLYDTINFFGNVSEEQAGEIKELLSNTATNESTNDWVKNAKPKDIVDRIQNQTKRMKDAVDKYSQIYDSISALAPRDSSSEYLEELVATSMQIDAYDKRFLTLLDETLQSLDTAFITLGTTDEDGNILPLEDAKRKAENIKRGYETIIAGSVLPVKLSGVIEDLQKGVLNEIEDTVKNDAELLKKVQDMRKLSDARKAFYKKYAYLRTEGGQKKFEEVKETQDKVEEEAQKAAAAIETSNLTDLSSVKKSYYDKPANERSAYVESLSRSRDKNPAIKTFLDILNKYDSFVEYYNSHKPDFGKYPETDPIMVESMIGDILLRAQSTDDIDLLPDNIFQSYEDFSVVHTNPFGLGIGQSQYEVTKDLIRKLMTEFRKVSNDTESRKTLAETKNVELAPVPADEPTGRDAAQGGSIAAQPTAPKEKKSKKKEKKEEPKKEPEKQVQVESDYLSKETVTLNTADAQKLFEEKHPDWTYTESAEGVRTYSNPAFRIETKEEPKEEFVVVSTQAVEQIAKDAVNDTPVVSEAVVDVSSRKSGRSTVYYRTSVPEISSIEARAAREAIEHKDSEAYKKCDLSDFVGPNPKNPTQKKNPGYIPTWLALNAIGETGVSAFEYVSTRLKAGDKIKFIIDPNFPRYEGRPQILVATEVDGKNQILTTLLIDANNRNGYLGLSALRDAIRAEYAEFIANSKNRGKVFEFSKQSSVICKRDGLIEYDYSGTGERALNGFAEYNTNIPIVFIDGNGRAIFARKGNSTLPMPKSFLDVENNKDRRGNLYCLVDSGTGMPIPIRLNVEHFRESALDEKSSSYPKFTEVRRLLSEISKLAQEANNLNVAEKGSEVSKKAKELSEILDIHNVDFVLQDWGGDIGVALAINTRKVGADGNEVTIPELSEMLRPQQATENKVIGFVAGLGRSLNIKYSPETRELKNLESLISSGAITTNAKMLRARGVDFYYNPYDASKKEFFTSAPLPEQIQAIEDMGSSIAQEERTMTTEEPEETAVSDSLSKNEDAEVPVTPRKRKRIVKRGNADGVSERENAQVSDDDNWTKYAAVDYANIPDKIKEYIEGHGWNENEWNNAEVGVRINLLNCR